jgi:type I site-specific restriction endonuclease
MHDDELAKLFQNIQLPEEIKIRLQKICDTPEGDVEARWIHRLIEHYRYSPKQLDVQIPAGAGRHAAKSTVVADIVVYRDAGHKEPLIVVEAKKEGETPFDGIKQAESYARNLGADYHV